MGIRQPLVLTAAFAMAACTTPLVPTPTTDGLPSPLAVPSALVGDCDGLQRALCQAAVAEALSSGLFLNPGERVARWRARPVTGSDWSGCGRPIVAVTFDITPSGQVTITLGQSPSRQLVVCTY